MFEKPLPLKMMLTRLRALDRALPSYALGRKERSVKRKEQLRKKNVEDGLSPCLSVYD